MFSVFSVCEYHRAVLNVTGLHNVFNNINCVYVWISWYVVSDREVKAPSIISRLSSQRMFSQPTLIFKRDINVRTKRSLNAPHRASGGIAQMNADSTERAAERRDYWEWRWRGSERTIKAPRPHYTGLPEETMQKIKWHFLSGLTRAPIRFHWGASRLSEQMRSVLMWNRFMSALNEHKRVSLFGNSIFSVACSESQF